ncbi:hypothetical protein KUTeg_002160 [Tegillarca granosa]|uniref:Uncharacterized protein n=1 Tax=Tegillarca granosa TaxID=220873 RepID=A0ABQ9FTI9_TEGGR|nr:hypothetical protein KUTeg_002160 [Tegillarca granosa]
MAGEMRQLAQTKIGQAIIAADIKELKSLIASGENVHFKDWKGNNYIHFVCTMYRPFIFYILVAAGVEVNIQNKYGYTPLHVTAAKEDNSCHVADLFVCGADPNMKARDNKTPMEMCIKNRYWQSVYEQYKPGIFEAVKNHDVTRVLELLHCWCKVDSVKDAIYGVLEVNHEKVREVVKKPKCNINYLNTGPLYFEAISTDMPSTITWKILMSHADFSLKDEKGRNAMIYAVDRCNGFISIDFFKYMLKNGAYIGDRDNTGSTIRDVARFARRIDLVEVIDKYFVDIIRRSDMDTMKKLTVDGYDGMLIKFNYRDSFIYASGNESDEMVKYIEWLPSFQKEVENFHRAIKSESLSKIKTLIASSSSPEMLVNTKDKGLRSPLMIATLFLRLDVVKHLLNIEPPVDINTQDCCNRTAYHYAVMLDTDGEDIQNSLISAGIDISLKDVSQKTADDYQQYVHKAEWLKRQRMGKYGLEFELKCVDKYEELRKIIRGKRKGLIHFTESIRLFPYPVAKFPKIYTITRDDEKCDVFMTAIDRAWHLKLNDLAAILTQKQERQLQFIKT